MMNLPERESNKTIDDAVVIGQEEVGIYKLNDAVVIGP